MASSRLLTLLGPPFPRNSLDCARIPPKLNLLCCNPSPWFRCCTSSPLSLDSDAYTLAAAADDSSAVSSAHPWPEWVKFVDRLKAKGYLGQNAAVLENGGGADNSNQGASVYTEMKLVKDACLNFGRDRFDIFKLLSMQDIETIVKIGCPTLIRKAVNSSKRLRAYLKLDEVNVCNSCYLHGSCDRANILLSDADAVGRTVDVVRILLLYALDPIAVSGQMKPPGRELIESSARKLLSELIELGDTPCDPNVPNPVSSTPQRKKSSNLSDDNDKRSVDKKLGHWVCIDCNFMNFVKNGKCLKCKADRPANAYVDGPVRKQGDWDCPQCNFLNFAKNGKCLKCSAERDGVDKKKGDWDCPRCSFLNFARNRECFRCQEPRPLRQLRPGDWECPECDFLNFSQNTVCRKCNVNRPPKPSVLDDDYGQTWKRPY